MLNESTGKASSNPVNIGSKKQLFLDDTFVESSKGVRLTLNQPYVPEENILPQDKPWEAVRIGGYSSVLEYGGAYHLWYNAYGGTGDVRKIESGPRFECYTFSTDGVHWEKPNVCLIPFRGSKQNNIVRAYDVGMVFVDPFDDPKRRFKSITYQFSPTYDWPPLNKIKRGNIYLEYSPDGMRWDIDPEPVLPFYTGAPSSTVWDDNLQRWIVYLRVNPKGTKTDPWSTQLAFARIEVGKDKLDEPYPFTPDPKKKRNAYGSYGNPTYEFPIVFQTDNRDPDHQVYKMNAVKYPDTDLYVSFPGMWHPSVSDRDDVQFAFSYDGTHWKRPFREAIIRLGMPGSGCEGYIDLADGMIRRGDELWLYYTGLPEHHLFPELNWESINARAIYRLDGFISVDFDYDGGELVTRPVTFSGSSLLLNLDTSAGGWGHIELLDETGQPIAGYTLKDSDKLNGNSVGMKASWGSWPEVSSLMGKAIRIRFVMRDCRLYAYQFV